MPFSNMYFLYSLCGNLGSVTSKFTMLVWIDWKSTLNSGNSANLLASSIVIQLSFSIYTGICSNAHNPAAVKTPVCRMVPPRDFLMNLSFLTKSLSPKTTAPVGQHKLFEKQMVIESYK